MDRTIAFLLLVIALLAGGFGYYALNNKPITTKEVRIDSILVKQLVHDSIYKTKIIVKRDSFIKYVTIRDSILKDTAKIDSVLDTKVDTTKDLRITAIVLADSLTTCEESLADAREEIAYKDTAFASIGKINKEKVKNEFDYKTASISFAAGTLFVLGVLWVAQ